jgi:hypothetical protein
VAGADDVRVRAQALDERPVPVHPSVVRRPVLVHQRVVAVGLAGVDVVPELVDRVLVGVDPADVRVAGQLRPGLVLRHHPQRTTGEGGRLVALPAAGRDAGAVERIAEAPDAEQRVALRPRPVQQLIGLAVPGGIPLLEDALDLVVRRAVLGHRAGRSLRERGRSRTSLYGRRRCAR